MKIKINSIANFINNNKPAQKVLNSIDKNPALVSAGISFVMAGALRPALMELTPFKEEKDRKCSQASAVAAGLTELALSTPLFLALGKSLDKSGDRLIKSAKTIYEKNPDMIKSYKSVMNRGIKVLALIPISFARFSLVKPIMNKLFGGKNENR